MPLSRFCFALIFLVSLFHSPTSRAQISKGNFILMDRGLQIQGMVTKDDGFHLNTYSNAHYSSINWLWESDPPQMGIAPGFPWSRWAGTEINLPPQGSEGSYLPQLVSLQLGDEWHLNDSALRDRAVNWFDDIRADWPDTILYMNNYGGQVSEPNLADFISRAQPDMLCFDTYPWKSVWDVNAPNHIGAVIGGTPTTWYSELRKYRDFARGYNIPFGTYMQTFHSVQDYDQTVYRNPSPSELRLNHSAALAFNAKVLIDFTYNTGASSLFNPPGGDSNPNALYSEKADTARRARHLGKALVRLKPIDEATIQWTTSMMFIRGKDSVGNPNPIPINFVPDDALPNTITDWVYQRNDPYLIGWVVTNKGTVNNQFPGDVIVSWLKPLDENLDGTNFSNQIYLMVVNGLVDPSGTAADCVQEIKFNFAGLTGAMTNLIMLDPTTGTLQTNGLPVVNTRRQLVLNLNGGDAFLFKFNTGAPFVGFYTQPPKITANIANGNLAVSIQGTIGARYELQTSSSLTNSNWSMLTNLNIPSTPFVFTDALPQNTGGRFYRAVGIQP